MQLILEMIGRYMYILCAYFQEHRDSGLYKYIWRIKTRILFMSGTFLYLLLLLLLISANVGKSNLEIIIWIPGVDRDSGRNNDSFVVESLAKIHPARIFPPTIPPNKIQSNPYCDSRLKRTAPPAKNTIAIGCAVTTKGSLTPWSETTRLLTQFRQIYDILPFFSIFLPSFCRTISPGFRYKLFVAYDYNDPYMKDPAVVEKFKESFTIYTKRNCIRAGTVIELQTVPCSYAGKPAWAQNDALMKAYQENFAYYFMVNDDTEISGQGWTEALVNGLAKRSPPNFGLVGPRHIGDNQAILTHNFAHKTHIDLFTFFYPRVFDTWYADEWITRVYSPAFMKEIPEAIVHHGARIKARYKPRILPPSEVTSIVDSHKKELRKAMACFPDFSHMISLVWLALTHRWLVQERRNSSALAMELRLSCTNPLTWRRHGMKKLSALLDLCQGNLPVTGSFPHRGPLMQCFDVFRQNNLLNKQRNCWWLEM